MLAPEVHDVIGRRPINFRRDVLFAGPKSDYVRSFKEDALIAELLDRRGRRDAFTDRMPRHLYSAAAALNEVRRHILSIRRSGT